MTATATAPPASDPLERPARPAASYEEARERLRALQALDGEGINPLSHSILLGPWGGGETGRGVEPTGRPWGSPGDGRAEGDQSPRGGWRTPRVYVCLHGLSNSPQQYVPLAARFVARGDSVLIPRLPRHGNADRMTTDLAGLTAADLLDTTAEAIDLAAGLGEEVVVTGISLGGVLATWAAQERPVARVVIVAPAIGLPVLPAAVNRGVIAAALRLRNYFMWWDPRYGANLPGPPYAYPRFATHALARVQRLGFGLIAAARSRPPAAREVWLVTNGADAAINNGAVRALAQNWRLAGASQEQLRTFEFPRRLRLFHDIVDPLQPYQKVALTHPVLEQIIADAAAPDPATLQLPASPQPAVSAP